MNDEEIKQRIRYLVEHGGIYDDPIADLRRRIRWLYALVCIALGFHTVEALVLFV